MNREELRRLRVKCYRCGSRTQGDKAVGWNSEYRAGFFVGFLCPSCQTPEENAEAEINDATLDYSTQQIDAFGRLAVTVKTGDRDE